jgi:hypothetical protein
LDETEKFSSAKLALMSHDARIRNRAAIELMDSGNPEVVAALVAAIEKDDNRQARGTLIYALSGFDCSSLFSEIFRWAIEGGFEASHEAISILREQSIGLDDEERAECLRLLSAAHTSSNTDDDILDELRSLLA